MGDAARWPELAAYNMIHRPDRIFVGQTLILPYDLRAASHYSPISHHHQQLDAGPPPNYWERQTPLVPAWAHVFVIADEFNPLRRELVRKVVRPTKPMTPEEFNRIVNPQKYGFDGIDPSTNVPLGRHIQGMTNSRYISASERAFGSSRFEGSRYWIDAAKAEAAGVTIHETTALQEDVDRVLSKLKNTTAAEKLKKIKDLSRNIDREVLLEGHVPAYAIKGEGALAATRSLQVVQGVGIVISIYDPGKAGQQSYREKSIVPIAKETVRQSGGWAGAAAGAELGGMLGAAVGIETGPGAIITAALGSVIFGTAGFLGADWAVRKIGGH